MARIEALDDDHACVVSQLPVQLPVADVERHDSGSAALSSTSVKPPVDAPMSRQSRPDTSMWNVSSACASLRPPRPAYG